MVALETVEGPLGTGEPLGAWDKGLGDKECGFGDMVALGDMGRWLLGTWEVALGTGECLGTKGWDIGDTVAPWGQGMSGGDRGVPTVFPERSRQAGPVPRSLPGQ